MPQKYQKEIEEILQQAGDLGLSDPPKRQEKLGFGRLAWEYFKQSISGSAFSITPGRIMLGAVLILLVALVLNLATPGFGIVGILAWVGFILFIVGYAMFFIKPKPVQKRWRGDVIEYHQGDSLWDKLRNRFQ